MRKLKEDIELESEKEGIICDGVVSDGFSDEVNFEPRHESHMNI